MFLQKHQFSCFTLISSYHINLKDHKTFLFITLGLKKVFRPLIISKTTLFEASWSRVNTNLDFARFSSLLFASPAPAVQLPTVSLPNAPRDARNAPPTEGVSRRRLRRSLVVSPLGASGIVFVWFSFGIFGELMT